MFSRAILQSVKSIVLYPYRICPTPNLGKSISTFKLCGSTNRSIVPTNPYFIAFKYHPRLRGSYSLLSVTSSLLESVTPVIGSISYVLYAPTTCSAPGDAFCGGV